MTHLWNSDFTTVLLVCTTCGLAKGSIVMDLWLIHMASWPGRSPQAPLFIGKPVAIAPLKVERIFLQVSRVSASLTWMVSDLSLAFFICPYLTPWPIDCLACLSISVTDVGMLASMLLVRVALFFLQYITHYQACRYTGGGYVSETAILRSLYLGSNKARIAARLTAAGAFKQAWCYTVILQEGKWVRGCQNTQSTNTLIL